MVIYIFDGKYVLCIHGWRGAYVVTEIGVYVCIDNWLQYMGWDVASTAVKLYVTSTIELVIVYWQILFDVYMFEEMNSLENIYLKKEIFFRRPWIFGQQQIVKARLMFSHSAQN